MSLDALAPDQRAVVQLVLQQDRSYEDLAALLGITPEAVRERAHRGLERLAPGEALDPDVRAQVSDYLLGQQTVSGRESTRALLTAQQPARSWALAIASELAGVARSPLPEVPAGAAAADPLPEPEPEVTEPTIAGDADPILTDPIAPTRARPRPRQRAQATTPPADFGFGEVTGATAGATAAEPGLADDDTARTSRLGGAMLISGLAIAVAALVIWLVTRDSDDPGSETATTGVTATATSTATGPTGAASDYVAIGQLALEPTDDGDARGAVELYFSESARALTFNVVAENLEPNVEEQAYGLWLTGGKKDRFLGYAGLVGDNGQLLASGRPEDSPQLLRYLSGADKQFVISRETEERGSSPAAPVLAGALDDLVEAGAGGGGGAATPTPTP